MRVGNGGGDATGGMGETGKALDLGGGGWAPEAVSVTTTRKKPWPEEKLPSVSMLA